MKALFREVIINLTPCRNRIIFYFIVAIKSNFIEVKIIVLVPGNAILHHISLVPYGFDAWMVTIRLGIRAGERNGISGVLIKVELLYRYLQSEMSTHTV